MEFLLIFSIRELNMNNFIKNILLLLESAGRSSTLEKVTEVGLAEINAPTFSEIGLPKTPKA